jgi:hypothetical protein
MYKIPPVIGVWQSKAKECLESPETGRNKDSPQNLWGSPTYRHLDFRLLPFRALRE